LAVFGHETAFFTQWAAFLATVPRTAQRKNCDLVISKSFVARKSRSVPSERRPHSSNLPQAIPRKIGLLIS
jgi:hypothetical protein